MPLDDEKLTQAARIFNALGNTTRLMILKSVSESQRPLHIKALSKALKKRYTSIYRHVAVLRKAGLITVYEVGRSRVVVIREHVPLHELVEKVLKIE